MHDGGMPATFWDRFWDSDYRQRTDIEDLRDSSEYVAMDVQRLGALVTNLQRQVSDLSMLASVLVKMLGESGQLDAKTLRYRVEAELEAAAAARMAPPPVAGNAPPKAEPPPTTPTTCAKCKKVVPANRTTITEAGTICDECAAR